MKCVYCMKSKTRVVNSREIKNVLTWRRRYCSECKGTFTTKESPLADNLFVIKRNGARQRFVYEKLFASLFYVLSFKKNRDSGDDAKIAKKISEKIIKGIFSSNKGKEVSTDAIIVLAHGHLKKIGPSFADQYIYYSPYRREVAAKHGLIRI